MAGARAAPHRAAPQRRRLTARRRRRPRPTPRPTRPLAESGGRRGADPRRGHRTCRPGDSRARRERPRDRHDSGGPHHELPRQSPQPIPADAPKAAPAAESQEEDVVTVLKGLPKTLASNMDASLTVPTATSVRTIPAKLMIDNRIVINNHLRRARGGKISFTHLIAWAMVQTLKEFPSQNVYYAEIDGKPSVVAPAHVTLGIAIDLPKPDGTRSLMVPGIKRADTMGFRDFLAAYEDVVARARTNKLTADDFAGITVSLTNPGGIGTEHSVPRLMKGQGCIIGAGALEYPAAFQGSSEKTLAELGIGKTITLTSTYDHRVIQGAGSGEFLKKVHELLIGERGFYEGIFASLRIPYDPIHWAKTSRSTSRSASRRRRACRS